MLDWLKRRTGRERAPRPTPQHVWDLVPGDSAHMALTAPEGLSGVDLVIEHEQTLVRPEANERRRILQASGAAFGPVRLWRTNEDLLALSRILARADVETLLNLERLARVFDDERPPRHKLKRRTEPGHLKGWTAPIYRQEGRSHDTRYLEDNRDTAIDHYRLVGDDRAHVLEIEVFDGGRTEIHAISIVPPYIAEELWPAPGA